MKELRIPTQQDNVIEVSDITFNFPGIIVCYKGKTAKGIINYNPNDMFVFQDNIDHDSSPINDETLIDLIRYLVKREICDNFKVITFE